MSLPYWDVQPSEMESLWPVIAPKAKKDTDLAHRIQIFFWIGESQL